MGRLKNCDVCATYAWSHCLYAISNLIVTVFAVAVLNAQAQQTIWSLKGAWSEPGAEGRVSCNLALVGGTHWPYTNSRLTALDLADPTNPVPLSSYETELQIGAIRVAGNYAYLAEGNFQNVTNNPGALEIVDVSHPTNLLRVASVTNLGFAHNLEVVGNYAYVPERARWTGSNSLGALSIFDVSNPSNPVRIGQYVTNGHFHDLHINGNYAYVAGGDADLLVFDVGNPSTPVLVGTYNTNTYNEHTGEPGGPALDIDVVGPYVTSAGLDGLHVIDVSNPSAPLRVGGWTGPTFFMFRVVRDYAFSREDGPRPLEGGSRWWMFDVSDPPAVVPFNHEIRDTRWPVEDIVIADPYVYLASGTNGLLVFKMETMEAPPFISVTRQDDALILTWKGAPGLILQWTVDFDEWIDVSGSEGRSRMEIPVSSERAFFRLFMPLL